jgi:hypothetical protein
MFVDVATSTVEAGEPVARADAQAGATRVSRGVCTAWHQVQLPQGRIAVGRVDPTAKEPVTVNERESIEGREQEVVNLPWQAHLTGRLVERLAKGDPNAASGPISWEPHRELSAQFFRGGETDPPPDHCRHRTTHRVGRIRSQKAEPVKARELLNFTNHVDLLQEPVPFHRVLLRRSSRICVSVSAHEHTDTMSDLRLSPEETLKLLARALAPYIAEELKRLDALANDELDPNYDARCCRRFVAELGDQVLRRAENFFEALARDGVIDSLSLASLLGVAPRELSGNLTTPLKRRAASLQLSLPFDGGLGGQPYGGIPNPSADMDSDRTHWQDRDGIARRMVAAIQDELAVRHEGAHAPARAKLSGAG